LRWPSSSPRLCEGSKVRHALRAVKIQTIFSSELLVIDHQSHVAIWQSIQCTCQVGTHRQATSLSIQCTCQVGTLSRTRNFAHVKTIHSATVGPDTIVHYANPSQICEQKLQAVKKVACCRKNMHAISPKQLNEDETNEHAENKNYYTSFLHDIIIKLNCRCHSLHFDNYRLSQQPVSIYDKKYYKKMKT